MRNTEFFLGLGILLYLNRNKASSQIGKLEDTGFKSGGRADQYWNKEPFFLDRHYFGNRSISMRPYMKDQDLFLDNFSLAGVEYGNWMNQHDRKQFFISTALSFADMARVLGIPHKKIGKGRLGMAYGARGRGPAMAHYERGQVYVINLTKTKGPGSLAHEYGHFMDNVLAGRGRRGFLSGGRSVRTEPRWDILNSSNKKTPEYHMERLFQILYWEKPGVPTDYLILNSREPEYWRRRTEVFARVIEAYTYMRLKELVLRNSWLVSNQVESDWPPLKLVRRAEANIMALIRAFGK